MNNIFVLFICLLTVHFGKTLDDLEHGLKIEGFTDETSAFQESHVKKRPEARVYPTHNIPDVSDSVHLKGIGRNRTVWDTSDSTNKKQYSTNVSSSTSLPEQFNKASVSLNLKDNTNITKSSNAKIKNESKITTPHLPMPSSLDENSKEDSSEESDEEESLHLLAKNTTNSTSDLAQEFFPVTTTTSSYSLNTSASTQLNDNCDNSTLCLDSASPKLNTENSLNISLSSDSMNESRTVSSVLADPTDVSSVPSTIGKPSSATMGDTSSPSNQSSKAALVIAILIIIAVCALIGFIGYRRLRAYWSRRHYARVDFLIDGLYDM